MSIFGVAGSTPSDSGFELKSVRFDDSSSACLSKSFGGAQEIKIYTLSLWVKRSELGRYQSICSTYTGAAGTNVELVFNVGPTIDGLDFYYHTGSAFVWGLSTTQQFRDVSSWYHLVIIFNSTLP